MTLRTRRDLTASMQRHPSHLAEVRSLFPQPASICRPEALRLVGPVGSAGMIPVRWQNRIVAVALAVMVAGSAALLKERVQAAPAQPVAQVATCTRYPPPEWKPWGPVILAPTEDDLSILHAPVVPTVGSSQC